MRVFTSIQCRKFYFTGTEIFRIKQVFINKKMPFFATQHFDLLKSVLEKEKGFGNNYGFKNANIYRVFFFSKYRRLCYFLVKTTTLHHKTFQIIRPQAITNVTKVSKKIHCWVFREGLTLHVGYTPSRYMYISQPDVLHYEGFQIDSTFC